MKKLQLAVMGSLITIALPTTSLAADVAAGAKVFAANCAQCHAGGRNMVKASKSLRKDDLERNDMFSMDAIINQVSNGKGVMPAFGRRLKPEQIESVALFVLDSAEKDWKR